MAATIISEGECPIDSTELLEAVAVLNAWAARLAELPERVRLEIIRLAAIGDAELCDVVPDGHGVAIVLKPEVRALVGTLRAWGSCTPAD